MRHSYAINERGELADGDGNVFGRVVEIVLELDGDLFALPKGEFLSRENSKEKEKEAFGKEKAPSPEVLEVWGLYSELISSRRRLGIKQRRDIERALKVRELETVKQSIVGLSRSPWHNGHNDTGTKYLDIRYALRGNGQRGESNEERIDRMAEVAASSPAPTSATRDRGVQEGQINSLKADIRRCWVRDARHGTPNDDELQRRDEAIQRLYGFGIMVRLDDAGKPTYEDIA